MDPILTSGRIRCDSGAEDNGRGLSGWETVQIGDEDLVGLIKAYTGCRANLVTFESSGVLHIRIDIDTKYLADH